MSKPTTARSVERQRLADAIERYHASAEQLDRVTRAAALISDGRTADRVAIGRARDAVAIARGAQSDILVMQALGEEVLDQPDLAAAEKTLADCEAKLDADRAALRTLEQERERVLSELGLCERALARAVAEVVTADPALAALRAEFEATRRRMSVLIGVLLGAGVTVSRVAWEEAAFVPAPDWTVATARLRVDPDARLPGIPPDGPDHAHGSNDKRAAA